MTHCDGLRRQLHQTLAQAAQTALFWGKKMNKSMSEFTEIAIVYRDL